MKKLLIGLLLGGLALNTQAQIIQGQPGQTYTVSHGNSLKITGEIYNYHAKRAGWLLCSIKDSNKNSVSYYKVKTINFMASNPSFYQGIHPVGPYNNYPFSVVTWRSPFTKLNKVRSILISTVETRYSRNPSKITVDCTQLIG